MAILKRFLCLALVACTAAQEATLEQKTGADKSRGFLAPRKKSAPPRQLLGEPERENVQSSAFFFPLVVIAIILFIQGVAYSRRTGLPAPLGSFEQVGTPDMIAYGPSMTLRQIFAAIECCGIEARNKYISDDGRLFMEERSDCLMRICCSVNRELTLYAHAGPSQESPAAFRIYKDFHLQGCCCCRPSVTIDTPSGELIGKIEDPFKCCEMDQMVYDKFGKLRYKVDGSVCQCGICCPLCADVEFEINDPRGTQVVGTITKPALTFQECCGKTNRFEIEFPAGCTLEDKTLLVGSAMLLDLEYFEQNKNDNNN